MVGGNIVARHGRWCNCLFVYVSCAVMIFIGAKYPREMVPA